MDSRPQFGVNYDVGWIGFTSRSGDIISEGISYFERWDDVPGNICVEHAFIVADKSACIEALGGGIQASELSKYFKDQTCRTYFRRPAAWTPSMGDVIKGEAQKHIGDRYGYGIIFADMLANTLFGHWLNELTGNIPNSFVSEILSRRGTEVCSQLAAMALQTVPSLSTLGCLKLPAREIKPQDLFVDQECFDSGFWRVRSL